MANPRLLLFGTPGVGKSALLDALVQSAPTLKADLVNQSPTVQHYRVHPEKTPGPFSDITVLDCSGTSALEMLKAEEPFADSHPMKNPILEADAVVFVVDVSGPKKQLSEDFRQAARWLKSLHEYRGKHADIAELPVYVVLSKCDLLADKGDTLDAWKARIEKARENYEENFRKYLKQDGPGFGTIKLTVLPTAIKHPPLAEKPAKGPLGVAELFRNCLASADDFQHRRHTAQGRLQNVVAGLVGLIAILGLSVAFLFEFQPPPRGTTLDEKVQLALAKPGATGVERLAGTAKKLEERQARLSEIEGDPEFGRLPRDTQEAVTNYRREIAKYLQLYQDSQTVLKLPHLAKNDAEFVVLEKSVLGFALPESYAKDWEDTRLGQRIRNVQREYKTLHAELDREKDWLRGQIAENEKLLRAGNAVYGDLLNKKDKAIQEAKDWTKRFNAQVNAKPPTPREDNVPGVSRVLYEDLVKYEPAKSAHKDWQTSKDDLTNISMLIQKKLRAGS